MSKKPLTVRQAFHQAVRAMFALSRVLDSEGFIVVGTTAKVIAQDLRAQFKRLSKRHPDL